jgi:MoxR-like ATPase/CHAT domain-containing protein/predicted RNA-binding protein with PUA-like domain
LASVEFPAYVALSRGGVPLIAHVTVGDAGRAAIQQVPVQSPTWHEPREIEVLLAAEGFTVDGEQPGRLLRISTQGGGESAAFKLIPQSTGVKRIVVDFYYRSRPAGSIALRCEVLPQPGKQTESSPPALADPVPLVVYDEGTPPPDLELRATLSQDQRQISYRLSRFDPQSSFRWQPAGSVTLSDELPAWTAKILGAEGDLGRSAPTKGGEDALRRIDRLGLRLGEALLTPALREAFRRLHDQARDDSHPRTLLVTSDEPYIPWELLKPDPEQETLGVQYRLGRWLAGRALPGFLAISHAAMAATRVERTNGNDAVLRYFATLGERLTLPSNQPLDTGRDLLGALETDPVQLLHLEGQVEIVSGNPERSGFVLADGALALGRLAGAAAAAVERQRPLIFLNVSSAGGRGWTAADLAEWTRLLRAGASALIGPLWDIDPEQAGHFAITFYDQLWDGQPLGEALFRARSDVRRVWPNAAAWLGFAVWGDPNLRVQLADQGSTGGGWPSSAYAGGFSTGGTGDGGFSSSGTGDGLPFIPGTGTGGTGGGSVSTVEPSPVLPNDARIWFVSANPNEGTNWEKDLFAPGKIAHWTEVRNPAGQRNLEMARDGDLALAYSSAGRQEIVGLAEISENPDQQSDGRWAVWVSPLVKLQRGVTLDELRQATPDLAHIHNPMASFSPVTLGQWRTIRSLLVERNPDQQHLLPQPGEAAPALSWSRPQFSGDLTPGGRTAAQYALNNTGAVTLRRREPLTISANWRLAGQAPDQEPAGHQEWRVSLDADLAPGKGLPVATLSLDLPDVAGSYDVAWQAHADQWGSDMTPAEVASRVDVLPPAPPRRHGLAVEGVELSPPEVEPGAALRAVLNLHNSGDIAWQAEDILTIGLAWQDAAGQALAEPPKPQEHLVGAAVPPGERTTLALDDINAPAQPGDYQLAVTVGCDSWGVSAQGAGALAVRWPQPAFGAGLRLERQPLAELWPGERFEVAGQANNSGTEPWAERQVQVDAAVAGPDPARAERLRGAPQWLAATAPGASAAFQLAGAAPLAPAAYTVAVTVHRVDAGQPTAELQRSDIAVAVLDLARLNLADLAGQPPDGLPAAVQAQRLGEIGRRLADPSVDAGLRSVTIQDHLLPGLWSAHAPVSRAALDALFVLRREDETLDQTVAAAIAQRGGNLGALPALLSGDTPVDASLAWLDGLLPGPATAQPDAMGRQIVVMPMAVLAEPTLAPPREGATAVVTVEASKVAQRGGQAQVEPGRVTLRYGNQTFVSRNPMDDADWPANLVKAESISPRAYGEFLFDTLFNTDKLDAQDSTYNGYVLASRGAGHRLRMELVVAPDVGSYKWEYLRNARDRVRSEPAPPLAVYRDSPLVRFGGNARTPDAVPARPLRILVAICNPTVLGQASNGAASGLPDYIRPLTRLDAEAEVRAVEPALQRLQDELGIAQYQILGRPGADPVTFDGLIQALKGGWHVLHLVGHGVQAPDGRYFLVMEPDRRSALPVDLVAPERFETPQFNDLRLVVLSSCQSAQRERPAQKVLPSLAERLLNRGVPAVIAMQGLIKIEADQLFAQRFYEDLARTGRIDMAVASARYDLYHYKPEWWDWGMPVLYMSTHDGMLFQVDPHLAENAEGERSSRSDLEKLIKPAAQLFSDPDLAERVVNNSLQGYARSLGVDAQQVSRLAAAIAAQIGGAAPRSAPLARRQERQGWPVAWTPINGSELADFVRYDPDNPMELPPRVFHQAAAALNAGKHIVLTGAPGTGKTTLAEAICRFVAQRSHGAVPGYRLATATADWTTFDTVGGFVPLESGALQFRPGILLEAIREGRWIIIDEINRAEIDKAFGELFTVLSGQQVTLAHTIDGQPVRILPPARTGRWDQDAADGSYDYVVHPSWRIVGTMNVYDKSYLFNMSFAFMRRFAFVDVDLPQPDQYRALVERWLKGTGLAERPAGQPEPLGRAEVMAALEALLDQKSLLMKRRAIGPAITKDMMRYVQNRLVAGDEDLRAVALACLAEAFQLYAAPQLDSLDEPAILGIYGEIGKVFKPLLESQIPEYESLHALTLQRIQQMYPHLPEDEWQVQL